MLTHYIASSHIYSVYSEQITRGCRCPVELKTHSSETNLDKEVLKTIDLSVILKVLEKIVAIRLEKHVESNLLHDSRQSAYCTGAQGMTLCTH